MDGVSFCYPSADQPRVPVIQDIQLSLKAGESLAVVGSNGSGKTTLTKLLLGLYPPDTGTIFYDGIAHRELNPASLRHKSTAVFQNFIKYRFLLQDNIALSEAADMVKGRIGVLVTHRLGLAKLCTRIAFLKEGRILALGTHEQLLKTCPEYGELWEAQTERYQEADSC